MKPGKELEHEELTHKIIGCAIEVHKKLGPGFIESIYENAFIIELQRKGLPFERQRKVVIQYDGVEVGKHRLDLIVADTIVVELKAIRNIKEYRGYSVRNCEILSEGSGQRAWSTDEFFEKSFGS
jgi:GxxExxY protein